MLKAHGVRARTWTRLRVVRMKSSGYAVPLPITQFLTYECLAILIRGAAAVPEELVITGIETVSV
ncbi:hypothetical protein DOTSEDRAFT_67823 [Dothistroma septosporum NZE10]|uniref:Uncharacterized protein n=1 Tax=Dothistroma septosporum (strain NZE10 / CBS 128990) TaxID=675120 RepID=N1Q2K7_DOTSN|nr:hypothetical protein DOTSEDRAFT_67823 [Dothistroma septosporum NZE10]